MAALATTPTTSRLLLINSAAILAVFLFLAISPAPVTFPDRAWEGALLLKGAALLLAANLVVVRLGAGTRPHGTRATTETSPLVRMRRYEHYDVVDNTGVIGIVDEVLGDHTGVPAAFVVVDGWLGARRFLLPLSAIDAIDDAQRMISVAQQRHNDGQNGMNLGDW